MANEEQLAPPLGLPLRSTLWANTTMKIWDPYTTINSSDLGEMSEGQRGRSLFFICRVYDEAQRLLWKKPAS